MKLNKLIIAVVGLSFITSCAPTASQLEKVVSEHPEIIYNAIKKDPKKFFEVLNEANREARKQAEQDEAQEEQKRLEDEFKNPKQAKIEDGRVIFGPKDAPITVIEYSDFECPFCKRGYDTVKEVMKNYEGKVRVIYKHLPLEMHPLAMPAAQYYEAIALQDHSKAKAFHDHMFENQGDMRTGKEEFLKKAAKKVGADMGRLAKDVNSDAVKKRIEADMAEAQSFEFSGTPGFLVNGVSLKGAYPFESFKQIIDRHLGANK